MTEPLTVSFTASRIIGAEGWTVMRSVLSAEVPQADRYVTGAACGGDAFIGHWLHKNRPGAEHHVIVPADRSQVDPWWLRLEDGVVYVHEMPPGSTYLQRNKRLVKMGTMLFGFPAHPEHDWRSKRSGSWQACRLARRAGKLARWQCVMAPYGGRVERSPAEFGLTEVRRFTDA